MQREEERAREKKERVDEEGQVEGRRDALCRGRRERRTEKGEREEGEREERRDETEVEGEGGE